MPPHLAVFDERDWLLTANMDTFGDEGIVRGWKRLLWNRARRQWRREQLETLQASGRAFWDPKSGAGEVKPRLGDSGNWTIRSV